MEGHYTQNAPTKGFECNGDISTVTSKTVKTKAEGSDDINHLAGYRIHAPLKITMQKEPLLRLKLAVGTKAFTVK